jgi:hypothetical protein
MLIYFCVTLESSIMSSECMLRPLFNPSELLYFPFLFVLSGETACGIDAYEYEFMSKWKKRNGNIR